MSGKQDVLRRMFDEELEICPECGTKNLLPQSPVAKMRLCLGCGVVPTPGRAMRTVARLCIALVCALRGRDWRRPGVRGLEKVVSPTVTESKKGPEACLWPEVSASAPRTVLLPRGSPHLLSD